MSGDEAVVELGRGAGAGAESDDDDDDEGDDMAMDNDEDSESYREQVSYPLSSAHCSRLVGCNKILTS